MLSPFRDAAHQNNWIRTQLFQRDKVTAGKECVGRTLLSAAFDFVFLWARDCDESVNVQAEEQININGVRTGVSVPHGLRMNRSNTSFDSSRPRGVKRMTSPSRSSSPDPDILKSPPTLHRSRLPQTPLQYLEIHTSVQTQSQKEGFLQCSRSPTPESF